MVSLVKMGHLWGRRGLLRVFLVLGLGLSLVLPLVTCLFEDQVNKWDWRQRFVGRVKFLSSYHLSSSQSLVVATDKNILASLFIRNGSIGWRQVLENRADQRGYSPGVDAISGGDHFFGSNVDSMGASSLLTINANGRYVRSWDPAHGLLEWETKLPEDVVGEDEESNNQLLFNIRSFTREIMLAKFLGAPSNRLELHIFDVKTGTTKKSNQPISTTNWFKDSKDCSFISSTNLVCLDKANLLIQFLPIGEAKNFIPIPLSSFGLHTSQKPKYLKLVKLEAQHEAKEPIFGIDLGGDGYVLVKVQGKQINLVKVFPKVAALAVAPTSAPESGSHLKYGLFVLISRPESLGNNEVQDMDDFVLKQFRVVVYDLNSWEEVKELNGQFTIRSASPVITEQMFILPFFKPNSPLSYKYKILLSTRDESLFLASSQGKISWVREEALASILSSEILDLPLSELDANIEQAFGFHSNILTQFVARVTSQVYQLQTYLVTTMSQIMDALSPPPAGSVANSEDEEEEVEEVSLKKDKIAPLVRDKFGLHKIIVVSTETGKLFGLDTLNGKIIWSLFDEQVGNEFANKGSKKLPIFVQRTTAHYPHSARCSVVTQSGLIVSFDPMTGLVLDKVRMPSKVKQATLMFHPDDTHLKGILLLMDNSDQVAVYPSSARDIFFANRESYYLLVGDENSGLLEGYGFKEATESEPKSKRVWSLSLPLNDDQEGSVSNRMQVVFKRHNEHVHSQGRVLGDRNVLYKYMNPNQVVVATEGIESVGSSSFGSPSGGGDTRSKSHHVNLYLLDAVTGSILYSTVHKRAKGPVHLVHTENSILYSYYNEKSRRTEISSIELYEGLTQTNSTAFSSLSPPVVRPPIVEHQTFIFPTGMLAMVDTRTEKGITNKHLLIALPSGALLELPKAFLDPRRPLNPTPEHREEGLIPYMPELPIPSEGIINYNQSLVQVKAIEVAPSGLESTCLVFAYGLDIFYTRVTPSKTFDILKDDFDHLLITGVLAILVALAYVSKWLASRKTLKNAWK